MKITFDDEHEALLFYNAAVVNGLKSAGSLGTWKPARRLLASSE